MSEDGDMVENEEVEESSFDEEEARKEGWAPKEEWKGRPEDWVDAKEFNKRGREINSFLKKHNDRLKGELAEVKSALKEQQLTAAEFKKEFAQMKENAYKKAMADLKAQRREALKEGDHDTADLIDEQLDDMKEQVEKLAKKEEVKPTVEMSETQKTRLLNEWIGDNPWYDSKNADVVDAVDLIGMRLRREQPGLDGRDFLDEVTKLAKKKHPEFFGNPRRKEAGMVEGGKRGEGGSGGGKKTYGAMPAEVRAQCDRFVKNKMCSQEDFVKNYYEQEGV